MLPVYTFDPKYATDTDGFTFDLTAWVGDNDEIDGTPTATVTPNDAVLEGVVTEDGLVTIWISGGTAGTKYTIDLRVQTQGGPGSSQGRDCHVRGSFTVQA